MNQTDILEIYSTCAALTATETGEPDESTDGQQPLTRFVWGLRPEFDDFISGLDLRFYSPGEFLVKGGSNSSGACAGKNTDPPRSLWANIVNTAIAIDRLRQDLGYAVTLTSAYRGPSYNSCIGGASASQHMRFNALDFQGSQGSPGDWAAAARNLRDNLGIFRGGIGTYNTFVHIDTRGYNADW